MTDAERQMIVKLARSRGICEGSAADRQLSTWLAVSPGTEVFTRATRLIQAVLASGAPAATGLTGQELVRYCEDIAAASGGVLGMRKISAEERALLSQIAADLGARRS